MAMKAENMNQDKITALYCRLSVEDIKDDKDKKERVKRTNQTVSATKSKFFRTMLKSTVILTQCFSLMTAFRVRALIVAILTVCTEW